MLYININRSIGKIYSFFPNLFILESEVRSLLTPIAEEIEGKRSSSSIYRAQSSSAVLRMARVFSLSQSFISSKFQLSVLIPSSFTLGHRNRSTRSGKVKFIEIDLESSSFGADSEILAIRKLDDFVQRIIVERSTPDWLPFVPGSSFWVPPRRNKPRRVVDLFDKLVEPIAKEDSPSLANARGWPCLDFFAKGIYIYR